VSADTKRRALEALAAASITAERHMNHAYDLAKSAEFEGASADDIKAAMTTNGGTVLRGLNDGRPDSLSEILRHATPTPSHPPTFPSRDVGALRVGAQSEETRNA
jgi:hypothetical protein